MAMEYPMFCYQCEQTAGGKGSMKMGVCGKTPEVANLQKYLLIYQIKGISCYAKELIEKGENIDKDIVMFVETLFTTLTNVNFDADVHVEMLKQSQKIKEALEKKLEKLKMIQNMLHII